MTMLLLIAVIALNVAIAWWNARVVGQCWNEREFMGWWMRAVLWSALVQSVVGFSCLFAPISLGIAVLLAQPTPEQTTYLIKFAMSFWYVTIIFPVLGTGLIITIQSWKEFARDRSWCNAAGAGWNTYAMASNVYDASKSLGPALDVVMDGLSALATPSSDDDAKSAIVRLALAAILVSLLGSVLMTAWIVKRNMGTLPLPEGFDQPRRRYA